jgi:hypothetical protein
MTRVIQFADGHTSASAPSLENAGQEVYLINDNVTSFTDITGLTFDGYTSAFIGYELERITSDNTYRQTGEMIVFKDDNDVYTLTLAGFQGNDMILETGSIIHESQVLLSIDTADGQISYKSGDMTGISYTGKLKVQVTRIL